jgi:hypothetical protein
MQSLLALSVLGDAFGCKQVHVTCVQIVCTETSVTASTLLFKANIQASKEMEQSILGSPGRRERQTQ